MYVRKNWRGNQEWAITRHWLHWVHKTQDEDKQSSKKRNTDNWKDKQHGPTPKIGDEPMCSERV